MRREKYEKLLRAISGFLFFFLIISFIVTCCTMLFVQLLSHTAGFELDAEVVGPAAKWTLLNVFLLSLLFTVIDAFRRKVTMTAPVKKITEAAEKMMKGDFSVRIPEMSAALVFPEIREIADHMNKIASELAATETLRSDFIANVSHEIRTPLAVIKNYSALLCSEALTENERREYAETISRTAARLADMVGNILKLNKLENRQIAPVFSNYDLSAQLCECLLAFEEVWEAKNIEICADIDDGVIAYSEPEMMNLVWNNLISNAIKFTERGGRVSVSLHLDAGMATVTVEDTGCGISPEVGRHMFDKFYQGEGAHATEGNGLGLAMVRRVVDITGSEISVNSTVGVGTRFTVRVRGEENG